MQLVLMTGTFLNVNAENFENTQELITQDEGPVMAQ